MTFFACRECWREHSGHAPTVIDGRTFLQTGYVRGKHTECHFCKGDTWGDMFRYEEAPTEGQDNG